MIKIKGVTCFQLKWEIKQKCPLLKNVQTKNQTSVEVGMFVTLRHTLHGF